MRACAASMYLFIGTDFEGGHQFPIRVGAGDGVERVKQLIHEKHGIPPLLQYLTHDGLALSSTTSLADQGVDEYATLHLFKVDDLQRRAAAARAAADADAAERGTVVGKDGKVRLRRRRRTKAAAAERRARERLSADRRISGGLRDGSAGTSDEDAAAGGLPGIASFHTAPQAERQVNVKFSTPSAPGRSARQDRYAPYALYPPPGLAPPRYAPRWAHTYPTPSSSASPVTEERGVRAR
ncbi:hypothetical protein Q5752_006397 [Cryptotrichosporon argae]